MTEEDEIWNEFTKKSQQAKRNYDQIIDKLRKDCDRKIMKIRLNKELVRK